jgi:hypothetical protein
MITSCLVMPTWSVGIPGYLETFAAAPGYLVAPQR